MRGSSWGAPRTSGSVPGHPPSRHAEGLGPRGAGRAGATWGRLPPAPGWSGEPHGTGAPAKPALPMPPFGRSRSGPQGSDSA